MGHLLCIKCGEKFDLNPDETPNDFDNKCEYCGGNLKFEEDDSLIYNIYCTNCGTQNPEDSKFCDSCGKQISMGHLLCLKCGEKFDLNPDETPNDFDNKCEDCGGILKYREDDSLIVKAYCTNCGTNNPEDQNFCDSCGKQLHGINWKKIVIGCVSGTILGILWMMVSTIFISVVPMSFSTGLITGYLVNKNWKNGLIHVGIANLIVASIAFILIMISPSLSSYFQSYDPTLFEEIILIMNTFALTIVIFLLFGVIGGILGVYIKRVIPNFILNLKINQLKK